MRRRDQSFEAARDALGAGGVRLSERPRVREPQRRLDATAHESVLHYRKRRSQVNTVNNVSKRLVRGYSDKCKPPAYVRHYFLAHDVSRRRDNNYGGGSFITSCAYSYRLTFEFTKSVTVSHVLRTKTRLIKNEYSKRISLCFRYLSGTWSRAMWFLFLIL